MQAPWLDHEIKHHRLPDEFRELVYQYYFPVASYIAGRQRQESCTLAGVQGCQGSGKSTLAAFLAKILEHEHGLSTAVMSLDDFYLTRAERLTLAEKVHPLLNTRGVPGTHDIALAMGILDQIEVLGQSNSLKIPRFDKSIDDRAPESLWPTINGPVDVVIFEGWCVGVGPQSDLALKTPVNALEEIEDNDSAWRRYVNDALSSPYAALYARLSPLIVLKAPSFGCVKEWRTLQEKKLVEKVGPGASGLMSAAQLERFIQHYQRLTEHALDTLPNAADAVLHLGRDHQIHRLDIRP